MAALRRLDPAVNQYSPRYADLSPCLDFVLGSPEQARRASRLQSLETIQGVNRHLASTLEQAKVVDSLPVVGGQAPKPLDTWVTLLRSAGGDREGEMLETLRLAAAEPDPLGAVTDLNLLLEAGMRPSYACHDLRLAIQQASARGIERGEVVGLLKCLREHDPSREDPYSSLSPVNDALAHVLKGDTRVARFERVQALVGMQFHGRTAAQVAPLAAQLDSLRCPPEARAGIAQDFCKALSQYRAQADESLLAALRTVDGPEAPALWSGFRSLLDITGAPSLAASDLALAVERSHALGLGFDEVTRHLQALRRADPNLGNSYRQAKAGPALEVTLASTDASTRTRHLETLVSLQKHGRSSTQVLPLLKELIALEQGPHAGEASAVLDLTRGLLDANRSGIDDDLLQALEAAAASPSPQHRMEQFTAHFALVKRSAVALADLDLVQQVSASAQVPFDEVLGHLASFRRLDSAQGDDYQSYASARPALEFVASGASPEIRQRDVQTIASLHVGGRGLGVAGTLAKALAGLRSGPSASHEEAVRVAVVDLATKWRPSCDGAFLDLLGDLATNADATTEIQRYGSLLGVLGRSEQALEDLRLARELATRHGVDEGAIVDTVLNLRKADPGLKNGYRVACIRPTLESLVSRAAQGGAAGAASNLGDAATHFMKFQRHGRSAESAHLHETSLGNVPVPAADRPALEDAYVGILERYSSREDELVLDVLSIASPTPNPTATLKMFERLVGACQRPGDARNDLRLLVEKATRLQVPLDEATDLVASLRKGDPALRDSYDSLQALDKSLEWILQGKDVAARGDRAQKIVALQAMHRTLDEAVVHEQRLDALQVPDGERTAVREAYLAVVVQFNSRADANLLKLLEAVDQQPEAAALVRAYSALASTSGSTTTALVDLKALQEAVRQSGLPIEEVTKLLSTMRKGDPQRQHSYDGPVDLSGHMASVMQGPDAGDRMARAQSLATLWPWTGSMAQATQGLTWILATPIPKGGLTSAATTLGPLMRRLEKSPRHEDIRAIYQHMQEAGSTEKVSLWRRLTRQGGVYQATVWKTMAYSQDASSILSLLQALESCRFEGEDVGDAFQRVKKMLDHSGPYYEEPSTDVDSASAALKLTRGTLPWKGKGDKPIPPAEQWKRLSKLAERYHSPSAAVAVWGCMASAATEAEAEQRCAAFDRLRAAVRETDSAVKLFRSLARSLVAGQPVSPQVDELLALVKTQGSDLAVENWTIAHEIHGFSEVEKRMAQAVLGHANNADDLHALWERMQAPVQDESLAMRADLLRQLLDSGMPPDRALEIFESTTRMLTNPGEFASCGPHLVALATVLVKRCEDPIRQMDGIVAWLRSLPAELDQPVAGAGEPGTPPTPKAATDAEVTPLPELLTALASHALMGAELERAKALVRGEEQRKRRERQGTATAQIHVGQHEISLGGVRIKVRRD